MTSAEELLDAVAGWMERDLVPTLEGRDAFQARIALNALRIVGRELASDSPAVDRAALAAAAIERGSRGRRPRGGVAAVAAMR